MNVCPVLIGRDAEMAHLTEALARGGLVLVAGEAGIGKTRLLREFASRAEIAGHAVVWGRPESLAGSGPYSLVLDLLDDVASVARRGGKEAADLAESLGSVPGGAEPPARQIAARLRGVLALVSERPVVIVEDLQDADELSHAVLAHLARSAGDDGTLLVGTYRSEEADVGPLARLLDLLTRDRTAAEIHLSSLGEAGTAAMLEAMWGSTPSREELDAVERLGEGVPFFIEELAAARSVGGAPVPPTIARAVAARIERIDPSARGVMRAASLMIGPLDPAILAEVCDVPEESIPASLIAGVAAGLLGDHEGRLAFRHALVRESIAGSIMSLERAQLHARLAAAIEQRYAGELETHAAALARHLTEAGEPQGAATYWTMGGNRALRAAAIEEAGAHFEAALALKPDAPVERAALSGLAEVKFRLRAFAEARALFRSVADAAIEAGEPVEAARALSRLSDVFVPDVRAQGGERAAIVCLDEALSLLGEHDDEPLVAQLLIEKGSVLATIFGDAVQAEALLHAGAARAERLRADDLRAQAAGGLAWIAEFKGNAAESLRLGEEACKLAIRAQSEEWIGKTHGLQAVRLALRGRCRDALARIDVAREHFARGLGSASVVSLDHQRAWVLWRMGAPAEADRYASRLETSRFAQLYGRVVRAWAAVERGDADTALAIVSSWWDELGDPAHRREAIEHPERVPEGSAPETYALLAELVARAYIGGTVDAEVLLLAERYDEECRSSPHDVSALAALMHARVRVLAGHLDRAEEIVSYVEDYLLARPYPLHQGTSAEIRGLIAVARRDPTSAVEHFKEASVFLQEAENLSDRARCLRLLAESLVAKGERDGAPPHLKNARELAVAAGALDELNRIEAALRSLGVRPRVGRPKGPRRPAGQLSTREEEVVALVAAGSSNAEIGSRLFISRRTVEDHIASAQHRLGLSGRAALAAWAARSGLV